MLLANQHFTLVIGIDVHFNTLPPFNPLHPFIGLVIDPMDYVPFIGGTVLINGRQRGVSDTSGKLLMLKHIPLGTGPFALMPMIADESVNFFGSVNTFADGSRLSPTTYMLMTCNDVGIPLSMQPGKKFKPIPSLFAPTSVTIPIPSGPPVMVGGPYVPDLAGALKNLLMGYGFGALMKVGGKVLKKAMTALNKSVLKKMKCTNGLSEKFCHWGFEPIDLINGRVGYWGTDFELPGPLPLIWKRSWFSDSTRSSWLGHGTHLCYDLKLEVFEEGIGVMLPDGRATGFDHLSVGESYFNRTEQLTLTHQAHSHQGSFYTLFDHASRLSYTFEATTDLLQYAFSGITLSEYSQKHYQLTCIENELGHAIHFFYRTNRLVQIKDSAHRLLDIDTDTQGRITDVHCEKQLLIHYAYNEEGDLVEITDALGQTTRIHYENHQMVRKTDRNGVSFHWAYEHSLPEARCIHTWGDKGVLEGWVSYQPGYNLVTDSEGNQTRYDYQPDYKCTQITSPMGGKTLYEYDAWGELYRVIDPDGHRTGYHYDEQGRMEAVTQPDNSVWRYNYDEQGRLKMVTSPEGAHQIQVYEDKKLLSRIAPDGAVTLYHYNADNLIEAVEQADGKKIRLLYDQQYNLIQVQLPDGSSHRWHYDRLGRCRESSRNGQLQLFSYDTLGRITDVQLPDGNQVHLRYNAYQEVIEAFDHRHHVRFAYTPMGQLKMREQNGTRIHFDYNKQEELLSIRNEKGERYRFGRNKDGAIISEEGFDGLLRRYERSAAGRVLRVDRPGGRWTDYEYDAAGRVVRSEYSDGSWEIYGYNKNGELISARNETSELHLERDVLGRVLKEIQDGYQVKSAYNALGYRIGVSSNLGAKIDLAWDDLGQVKELHASQGDSPSWQAQFAYNGLGQEVERILNGNLYSSWDYDAAGRPLQHRVYTSGGIGPDSHSASHKSQRLHRHKRYHWSVNDTLKTIQCMLTGAVHSFDYDGFGNLVSALGKGFDAEHFFRDEVGNMFSQKDHSDRSYDKGGQLKQRNGARYEYDEEGFLIKKTEKEGQCWHYHWQGNGMLKEVIRPDRKTVRFEYDALGRRTAKIFEGQITRWVWDGNTPLHEWTYEIAHRPRTVVDEWGQISKDRTEPVEKLISWIFEEGTFKPAAKLEGDIRYSIINDYLGTPKEVYNASGEKVWDIELSAYGQVRECSGDVDFVPFRFQGQYHDRETGLYYNRFRYYSPQEGMYVSQDPIGLLGGRHFYAYVHDPNTWLDVLGLAEMVDPNMLNFSQAYVKGQTLTYEKAMKDGTWDWNKFPDNHPTPSALRVVEVNGELVSLDNRRLLAAQNAGLKEVPIIKVKAEDAMPGGGTYGKNLAKKLYSSPSKEIPKVQLPPTGTKTKPIVCN
ncbi:RHS repeat-associated core domain-containing protein [Cytophagaceae bacterium DM2B3-1]|uniref:RHS repeat-associated core domain-containing protein n=1 Tax=Xanthocytophaga flava TaxID=3048013 RepID=A0ABT7CIS3_9BACT|nr:RHS repeat-associated core domain-containing protein [Xanthocytophaga flavus]MDJ1469675.1 RHS repeat-associated core domain-containing protein [Xanthocytophaga flavus]MDJ1493623.1 RHS repeat-associated core domain-containing protein [Xanthocytophaga flavus]